MTLRFLTLCLLLWLPFAGARADVDWVSVIWQNDLMVGKDGGGYTNGLFVSWYDLSEGRDDNFRPPWLTRPLVGRLLSEGGEVGQVATHTLGQAMITPEDIGKAEPDANDAPYAGLLFWRSGYLTVDHNRADSVTVTVGMVGPSSGAESVQRWVHKVTGSTRPRGWDYQLKDEPVGQVERARVWRFAPEANGRAQADLLLLGSASVGNLESGLGTALIGRYGTRLQQSFSTASQMTGRTSNPMALDGGWNVYLGVGADYVYNQIFVSGSGIRSGPKAQLRHDQYALYTGWSQSWERLSVTAGFVATTNLDKDSTARQRFGSLVFAWRW